MSGRMASDRPVREAENRLEHFNADRERLLAEVERRVVARRVAEAKQGAALEDVLNDVAFSEIKRLEASRQKNGALDRWKDLSRRLMQMSESEKEQELRGLVRYYGRDVVGNFDARVYKFATGIGPSLLNTLFSPTTAFRQGFGVLGNLDQRI